MNACNSLLPRDSTVVVTGDSSIETLRQPMMDLQIWMKSINMKVYWIPDPQQLCPKRWLRIVYTSGHRPSPHPVQASEICSKETSFACNMCLPVAHDPAYSSYSSRCNTAHISMYGVQLDLDCVHYCRMWSTISGGLLDLSCNIPLASLPSHDTRTPRDLRRASI